MLLFTTVDPDVYKTIVVLLFAFLVMQFILTMLKKVLEYKLKNEIIQKGIAEEVTAALLESDSKDQKQDSIKWALILFSTGIGLFIANQFLPLGIHSMGIMTLSISMGFGAYSYYLKQSES